jgi:hypothetical protein
MLLGHSYVYFIYINVWIYFCISICRF